MVPVAKVFPRLSQVHYIFRSTRVLTYSHVKNTMLKLCYHIQTRVKSTSDILTTLTTALATQKEITVFFSLTLIADSFEQHESTIAINNAILTTLVCNLNLQRIVRKIRNLYQISVKYFRPPDIHHHFSTILTLLSKNKH